MNSLPLRLCSAAAFMVATTATAQDCITTAWSFDVESYVDGQNIVTGQACFPECPPGNRWAPWEGRPEGAGSHADAAFGNPGLSLNVWGQRPSGVDDLVHTYHDFELMSETWRYGGDLYVRAGSLGESYFIMLTSYVEDGMTSTENWVTQIRIDGEEGKLESDFDGNSVALQYDSWRRLEVIIDFDEDRQTLKYDDEVIVEKVWVGGGHHGPFGLAAVNFYGNDADPVYWDNLELCSISSAGACCFRSDPCLDDILRADCEGLQGDAIFQGIGSVCGACPFYGADGWEIDELLTTAPPFRWGGDTCFDFPGILDNPDCEFFPQDCSECDLEFGQEQAWSFLIPWTGTWTFSTCGAADFDTAIYAGTAACLGDLGFNDDCVRIPNDDDSELPLPLVVDTRVAITLEGMNFGDCGLYTLSVGAPCPELAIGPDEETLGPCADEDTDPENRGCNAEGAPTFTDIECGQTFSGTVGNFVVAGNSRRDLDWFRLALAEPTTLTLDARGNYPQVVLFLAGLNANPGGGEDECTDAGMIIASDETSTCTDPDGSRAAAQVSLVVGPGLYAPVVSTAFVDPALTLELGGAPCGRLYELTVTCGVCTETGDVNDDGAVTFADIIVVLSNWGTDGPSGDANCDGTVSFLDLLFVLGAWG